MIENDTQANATVVESTSAEKRKSSSEEWARRLNRRAKRMLSLPLLLLIGLTVAILGCQRSIIFPRHVLPDVTSNQPPKDATQLLRELSQGVSVEAWLLPAKSVSNQAESGNGSTIQQEKAPLVVMAHGNGELIDYLPGQALRYQTRGLNVLLVEYRGYGRSGGKPSQTGIVSDFNYFIDEVSKRPEIDGDSVLFHGRSLGGGIVSQVAKSRTEAGKPPQGLILESTFTSIAGVARAFYVPRFLILDPLDVEAVIKTADYPVLIMHGREDRVVPVQHAIQNHAAAPESELLIFNAKGHNDMFPQTEYWQAVDTLLEKAMQSASEAPKE